jgi:8-oxo-dGTP diphosphatase
MTHTPPANDPLAYQEWVNQLEQKWETGLIPDPQTVAIILINERGEVLLQLRDNNPDISFPNSWTLPGGVVESPETPEQAARRELAEETGLHSSLSPWKVYKRKPENHRFSIEQHIYIGKTHQESDEMALGEGQALHFFRQDELPSLSIAFDFDKLLDEFFDQSKEAG